MKESDLFFRIMKHQAECQKWSDEELVSLTLEDKDYYFCLMRRYEEKLLHYVAKATHLSREECEDVLQNAFLKMYVNLRDFDLSLKFSSWAYRIVHNEMIDNIRKRRAESGMVSLDSQDGDSFKLIDILSDQTDIAEELNQKMMKEHVNALLDTLPMNYREVLILRYIDDKEYQEISDILRIPMGTVATLLNRAKKMLKEKIKSLSPHLEII